MAAILSRLLCVNIIDHEILPQQIFGLSIFSGMDGDRWISTAD